MTIKTFSGELNRRQILVAAGAGLALQAPFVRRVAAQTPLQVGMLLAKQGVMSNQGADIALGVQIAFNDRSNEVAGMPLQLTWLDEQNPQDAVQSYERLVSQQGAFVTLGGTTSANTLAVGASALNAKVPFIGLNSAAREPTGAQCNPYMFRVPGTVPVYAAAMAEQLLAKGKKWYFIVASFTFGEDVRQTFSKIVEEAGGEVVGVDEVPVGTTDYSSYLLKVRQAKPDVLVSGTANSGPILTQMHQMGLTDAFELAGPAVSDTDLWSVRPEALSGTYGKTWFYADPANPPEQKAFVEAFMAEYGKAPSDRVFQGWFTTQFLFKAIEESGATTGPEIAKALEETKMMEGDMAVGFRDWDHQFTRRTIIAEARPPQGDDPQAILDIVGTGPNSEDEIDAVYGAREASLCKMASI